MGLQHGFLLALAGLGVIASCGDNERARPASGTGGGSGTMDGGGLDDDPSCPLPPEGTTGTPSTIAEAVSLGNALFAQRAEAISLPCFLRRLDRPLSILGVRSVFSLQPAVGTRSPRIFIFTGSLVMSVVPAGVGSPFLELAQNTTPVRSLKAQMEFPLVAPVPLETAYDSVRLGAGSVCGACHSDEEQSPQVTTTKGFESIVFQPRPQDVVPVRDMAAEAALCDPTQEPDRCAMLRALFDHGEVRTGAFSPDAPTFFN